MDVNAQQPILTPMNHTFRSLLLTGASLVGLAAFAQPIPPYPILITGMVQGCMPNSQVTISSMPNTQPTWSYTLDLVNCGFDTVAWMQSPGGGFTFNVACNGAMLTAVGQYQVGPSGADSIMVTLNCSGGGTPDCLGVPGGSALPGTSCTTFLGVDGTWNASCECVPNASSCQACFTVYSNSPWTAGFMNCSTGNAPFTYQWWLPNGSASTSQNADWTFTAAGAYGVCLTIADAGGCTSVLCDTVYVDANGGVSASANYFDCLQIPNGPNVPGSPCVNPNGSTGIWNANCECVPTLMNCQACIELGPVINQSGNAIPFAVLGTNCSQGTAPLTYQINWGDGVANSSGDHAYAEPGVYGVCITIADASGCTSVDCDTVVVDANGGISVNPPMLYDCLQVLNGPNMPGTPCTNPATGFTGTWSADCVCVPDSTGGAYDCLGVLNGSNLPGTPCWTPGTNFIGVWDANCNCTSGSGLPCQAGFWVIQAYGQDSLPVPNEVWVWNLSTGNGALSYLWNFGDGTTSTDPFPTHTYSQNGPYLLCLTIADASGCTSTSCDSVSIDENGLLNGMILGGHDASSANRTNGFTLNVQNPLTTSMAELQDLSHAAIWPNPSNGDLNLALVSTADGPLSIRFFDVNGREVRQESRAMNAGRSQHRFDIADLPAGIYTLRATDRNGSSLSIRFVKAR